MSDENYRDFPEDEEQEGDDSIYGSWTGDERLRNNFYEKFMDKFWGAEGYGSEAVGVGRPEISPDDQERLKKIGAWMENNDPTIHLITREQYADCLFLVMHDPSFVDRFADFEGGAEFSYRNSKGEVLLVYLDPDPPDPI